MKFKNNKSGKVVDAIQPTPGTVVSGVASIDGDWLVDGKLMKAEDFSKQFTVTEPQAPGAAAPAAGPAAVVRETKVAFTSPFKPGIPVGTVESHWGIQFKLVDPKGRFEAMVSEEEAKSLVEGDRAQIVKASGGVDKD
jgi:hypothetical protein